MGLKATKKNWLGLPDVFADINYFNDNLSNETIPVTSPTNPLLTIFSYGNATLKGADFTFDATWSRRWSTFANAEVLRGYYNSYYSTADNQSYNGAPVSSSPNLTVNAGVTYKRYVSPVGLNLAATLFDQYYGQQYLFNNNTGAPSHQTLGGYNVVNVLLTAKTRKLNNTIPGVKDVAFTVSVVNLLNRKYNSTAEITGGGYFNTAASGYVIVNPALPRAIYGSVSVTF